MMFHLLLKSLDDELLLKINIDGFNFNFCCGFNPANANGQTDITCAKTIS
jgi:hypothetical protein